MTHQRLVVCLSVCAFAYMAAFAALYAERVWPAVEAVTKALGS